MWNGFSGIPASWHLEYRAWFPQLLGLLTGAKSRRPVWIVLAPHSVLCRLLEGSLRPQTEERDTRAWTPVVMFEGTYKILEPPVEYVEGPKDLEGLILGRTFMEKMIKFTPASISVPHPPEEMVVGTKDRGRQRKTEWFTLCPETLFWVCTNVRKVSEKSGLLLGLAWNRIHLQQQSCLET